MVLGNGNFLLSRYLSTAPNNKHTHMNKVFLALLSKPLIVFMERVDLRNQGEFVNSTFDCNRVNAFKMTAAVPCQ